MFVTKWKPMSTIIRYVHKLPIDDRIIINCYIKLNSAECVSSC